jgi:hypothetical protein
MMCYGAKDLARAYRTVRENTIKIAEEIPDRSSISRRRPVCAPSVRCWRTSH